MNATIAGWIMFLVGSFCFSYSVAPTEHPFLLTAGMVSMIWGLIMVSRR